MSRTWDIMFHTSPTHLSTAQSWLLSLNTPSCASLSTATGELEVYEVQLKLHKADFSLHCRLLPTFISLLTIMPILPPELLVEVFGHLAPFEDRLFRCTMVSEDLPDHLTLAACCLISKYFLQPACNILYRFLTIKCGINTSTQAAHSGAVLTCSSGRTR